jgi:hypothetical protein
MIALHLDRYPGCIVPSVLGASVGRSRVRRRSHGEKPKRASDNISPGLGYERARAPSVQRRIRKFNKDVERSFAQPHEHEMRSRRGPWERREADGARTGAFAADTSGCSVAHVAISKALRAMRRDTRAVESEL